MPLNSCTSSSAIESPIPFDKYFLGKPPPPLPLLQTLIISTYYTTATNRAQFTRRYQTFHRPRHDSSTIASMPSSSLETLQRPQSNRTEPLDQNSQQIDHSADLPSTHRRPSHLDHNLVAACLMSKVGTLTKARTETLGFTMAMAMDWVWVREKVVFRCKLALS